MGQKLPRPSPASLWARHARPARCEDLPDRRARVERRKRILEDHLDFWPQRPKLGLGKPGDVAAFEQIEPPSLSMSLISSRPSDDLPEPLSPTTPSVRPCASSNETPLTAGTMRCVRNKRTAAAIGLDQTLDLQDRRPAGGFQGIAVLAGQVRHGRDQAARIEVAGRLSTCSALPCSTQWPFSITTTQSAISATTPKSWVMNITLIPLRR